MEVSETLFVKILPLYVFIILGYIGGRYLHVDKKSIASIVIYLVAPIVIFNGAMNAPLDYSSMAFALFIFVFSSLMCAFGYVCGRSIFQDTRTNAFSVIVSNGNMGAFGLPIALMLFDKETVGIYVLALFSATLFMYTVSYYIIARGRSSVRAALIQVVKLPVIYAFAMGIAGNVMQVEVPGIMEEGMQHINGTFTMLGMMILGLALSKIDSWRFDYRFLLCSLGFRVFLWPAIALLLVAFDQSYFGWFDERVYKVFILISFMPFAFTPIVFATLFNLHPRPIARSALVSTMLSLAYLPIVVYFLLLY